MKGNFLKRASFFLLVFCHTIIQAQFAPGVGEVGTTAVHKDSSIIVAWATTCTVERGLMDISQPSLGYASSGLEQHATGAAGDGMVVSLGDGGVATLTFGYPIYNGPGADFVVFENAFSNIFLELAFVEVSSDGINFVRFPSISNTDTSAQIGSFGTVDATKIHNLAGKYRANYGTPFDLEDLVGDSLILDIQRITHVRLVDVVGCMQDAYASRDSRGIKVNDPWSTPFAASGFDLDAVGVIHSNTNISVRYLAQQAITIYPNPVLQGQSVFIESTLDLTGFTCTIYSITGQLLLQSKKPTELSTDNLVPGIYTLILEKGLERVVSLLTVN